MNSKRRIWTDKQIKLLRDASRRGRHARSIARVIKRTESAVRQKAFSMGLSLKATA